MTWSQDDVFKISQADGHWQFNADVCGNCLFQHLTGKRLSVDEYSEKQAWMLLRGAVSAANKGYFIGVDIGRRDLRREFRELLRVDEARQS